MAHIQQRLDPADWAFLQTLARTCSNRGGTAYLVGGSIRSALLGEDVVDCDVEVFGMTPAQLERLLQEFTEFTRAGKAFGIYKILGRNIDVGLPRRESKSGEGHRGFEVDIRPDLCLEEAASRRDFTVNAIYYDLTNETLVDPLGGLIDLEKRILRHCSERFVEDPLRVLRAMQFASRIPADVASETIDLCRQLSPENLSAERFFSEWEKLILYGKYPSIGLNFLKQCGWVDYFPPLKALIGCPQDPRWHPEGDVWQHTLHCMDAFAQFRSGDRDEDLIVGLAVLCHDMGKPSTTATINGSICSHGHESAALKPAGEFLKQLKVSKRLTESILPLIKCHMRPAMLYADNSSSSAIRRLARDCGRLDLLLRVFQADAGGRPPMPNNSMEAIEWIRQESEKLRSGNSGPKPLVRGRDLLQRGWQSGPKLGEFLKRAYEEQLDGAFTNEDEARLWLEQNLPQ